VKVSQRSVLSAASLVVALAAAVAPAVAGAQRSQVPGPDTKRVLVSTFRGDQEGGVKAADEIRNRVAGDFSIKTLMPNSKKDIDATLVSSGYKPDSALNPNDIKELAKLLRADEVIDGNVTKTGAGYQISARMFLPRDVSLSQPLLTIESDNFGDVAKQVVHEYDESRKQLPGTQDCENAIRDGKLADAKAAARRGIAAYPKATLARLCLASAFQAQKLTADSTGPWKDSVIAITRQVIGIDKLSRIAYQLQIDAFKAKGDTVSLIPAYFGYINSDPTNSALKEQVINDLVLMGKAGLAVPFTKQLVTENPGDPQYARLNWLVLRAAGQHKEAVAAGKAYVGLDSAAADTNYFFRQINDLATDSAYAPAAEMAATGAAKFPNNVSLLLLEAQNQRRAGQIPAALGTLQHALQLDPKAPGANMIMATIFNEAGNVDSVLKYVRADVAAEPTNKDRDGMYLSTIGQQAYKRAAVSKKIEDFKNAITLLGAADDLSPSPTTKFFQAYSAFTAFTVAAADLPKTKSCTDTRAAQEYLSIVQTKMPGGSSFNAGAAQQVLNALPEYQKYASQSLKAYCKS
jgi:tetratricopeptide (TPR) repeat protein